MSLEMTELDPPEIWRKYIFPDESEVIIHQVTHLLVRESGTHRLKDSEGFYHIIPPRWNQIILNIGNFQV